MAHASSVSQAEVGGDPCLDVCLYQHMFGLTWESASGTVNNGDDWYEKDE